MKKAPVKKLVVEIISSKDLVAAIRLELKKIEIPKELKLNSYTHLKDVPKFLEGHLCTVGHITTRAREPYAARLKEVLAALGIDIMKVAKEHSKNK